MHSQPALKWEKRRVLVTGAGGFIGSHLCEALMALGADVTAMVKYSSSGNWGNLEFLPDALKRDLKVISGNVEDPYFVDKAVGGQHYVFHLAALIGIPYSYAAPSSYVRTNIEGTLNVLEASKKHGVERIIQTSTSETYGTAIYTPMDEKHPLQGQSPYSATKIAADKLAESFHLSFGLPVSTVRPFNTFGPRQSARAVIPTIVSQALARPEVKLGSLSPVRDLTFVKDTVQGFIAVAASQATVGKTINLGNGSGVTVGDLAKQILALMGCDKPIRQDDERVRPAESEVMKLICDSKQAAALAGWKPRFSLEEGLRQTIDFVRANENRYKPDRYSI